MSLLRYYPKNRIKPNQVAEPGQFILDGVVYIGPYYTTFDGKSYTGKDPYDNNANRLLTPTIADIKNLSEARRRTEGVGKIVADYETFRSIQLSAGQSEQTVLLEELTPYYPVPTEGDYSRGYFVRYFAKRTTDYSGGSIIEISEENYSVFKNRNTDITDYYYLVTDLFWKLTGPLKDDRVNKEYPVAGIINTNQRLVETKDKYFSGLKSYIQENYTKFSRPTNAG